jgi:hypothetical protein
VPASRFRASNPKNGARRINDEAEFWWRREERTEQAVDWFRIENPARRATAISSLPSLVDFLESGAQVSSEIPARIMRLHLTRVRDVANVVALAIVVAVLVGLFLPEISEMS